MHSFGMRLALVSRQRCPLGEAVVTLCRGGPGESSLLTPAGRALDVLQMLSHTCERGLAEAVVALCAHLILNGDISQRTFETVCHWTPSWNDLIAFGITRGHVVYDLDEFTTFLPQAASPSGRWRGGFVGRPRVPPQPGARRGHCS